MKKISWLFLASLMVFSCDLQNFEEEQNLNAPNLSAGKVSGLSVTPGDYDIDSSTPDGFTFTFVIDQSNAQDISHMLFQFTDCYELPLSVENVVSVTINDTPWEYGSSTGSGTGCAFENEDPFIKLDNFNFDGGVVTIVIVLNAQSAGGAFLIKSAANCFDYTFEGNCDGEPCYEYADETAWAAGIRYIAKGNWATYTSYSGTHKSVTLFAGQTINIGTVTFHPHNGDVKIMISFNEGWGLQSVAEGVKIQGYNTAPWGNPSPGLFTTYKGNDLEIIVPYFNFYGVHVDARYASEVECPE